MALIESKNALQDQSDFDRMKNFHDHSLNRHKRPDETKKAFRKRVRNLIKSERASGEILPLLQECEIQIRTTWRQRLDDDWSDNDFEKL